MSVSTFAQVSTNHVATVDIVTANWITYIDNQQVKIEYKRADCDLNSGLDQQYFFLKISNKTQNEINLAWEMDLFYNDDCKTCGMGEYQWTYELDSMQIVEGECTMDADKRLRLFSKFIDANYTNTSVLTGFKFSNLLIN